MTNLMDKINTRQLLHYLVEFCDICGVSSIVFMLFGFRSSGRDVLNKYLKYCLQIISFKSVKIEDSVQMRKIYFTHYN